MSGKDRLYRYLTQCAECFFFGNASLLQTVKSLHPKSRLRVSGLILCPAPVLYSGIDFGHAHQLENQ